MPASSQHKIKIVVEGEDKASGALKSAGSALDGFGKGARDLGGKLTGALTLPLVGLGALAIKASTDLNAAMANVASLGVPTERVLELKSAVQELAIATGKSTADLADGLYQVVSAFGDTADTVQILEINAKAAAAGLATTTDAINLTSAVTKGYGDTSAAAVQKASDLAFVAVQLGQTTFPELAGAIGMVVPLAQELSISQEELFATMATLTGVTGGASEVSTQLRGVLQSLMAPTGDMTTLMQKLGYANGEAMIQSLGMKGTIDAITAAAEATGTPLAKFIGSIEGQTLALSLSGSQSDTYAEKLKAMQTAAGATDAAFAAQTEGINALGFSWQQAQQKVTVFAQKLGDALAPALMAAMENMQPLLDGILGLANGFTRLSPTMQNIILVFAGVAVAIGPLSFAIGTLATAAGYAVPVLAALTGPVGLLAVGIGALVALNWDSITAGIERLSFVLWNYYDATQDAGWGTIESQESINLFPAAIQPAARAVDMFIGSLLWYKRTVEQAGFGSEAVGQVIAKLPAYLQPVIGAFDTFSAGLQTFLAGSDLAVFQETVTSALGDTWAAVQGFFSGDVSLGGLADIVSTKFGEIRSAVADLFGGADFSQFLTDIKWDDFITKLTWENFILAMTDWGAYITSLDWTQLVITALDWATWVPAMVWNNFVRILEWSAWVAKLLWGGYVKKIDWSALVDGLLDWGAYVIALPWGDYITAVLDWTTFVAAITWDNFVSKLKWPDLGIDWSDFVPDLRWPNLDLDWSDFIPSWPGWSFFNPFGGGTDPATNATGTPFWRGGQTWVGEKGPELVTLPRGSRILNHERSMAMVGSASSGGDTYNITFAPAVNSQIDLEVAFDQLLRKMERRRP